MDVGEWHLDIDKIELRWENYVKAAYYVSVTVLITSLNVGISTMSSGCSE